MKYFFHNYGKPELNLYPLSDWHIGAKQCNMDFIKDTVKRIKHDPNARWIYMGDGGEVVLPTSKGNVFEQIYNPGDQLRMCAEFLGEIKDKGLFGIRGNHGNRVDRETGVGWDELLCARAGIPYAGVAGFAGIQLSDSGGRRSSISVYAHHGSGGAITSVGKMRAATKPFQFIVADIILTGHTHMAGEISPPRIYAYLDNVHKRIRWAHARAYACGSAYDARSGYAEEKLYAPIIPEHICLHIKQVRRTKKGKTSVGLDIQLEVMRAAVDEPVDEHELAKWTGETVYG